MVTKRTIKPRHPKPESCPHCRMVEELFYDLSVWWQCLNCYWDQKDD